jgi:hypothetical protein
MESNEIRKICGGKTIRSTGIDMKKMKKRLYTPSLEKVNETINHLHYLMKDGIIYLEDVFVDLDRIEQLSMANRDKSRNKQMHQISYFSDKLKKRQMKNRICSK